MSAPSTPPARDAHFHQLYPKVICHVIPQFLDVARNPGPPSHLHYIYIYSKSLLSPVTGRHSGKRGCTYSAPSGDERTWSASTNADAVELLLDITRNPGSPPTFTPTKPTFLYLPPPPTDCTSVASTDNSQRSLNSSISQFGCSQMRPTRVSLLRVFFFFFFFFPSKEQVLL